jgi:diaminopimelate epimerase
MNAHIDLTAHTEATGFAINRSQDSFLSEKRDLTQHVLHRKVGEETVNSLCHTMLLIHLLAQLTDICFDLWRLQDLESLGQDFHSEVSDGASAGTSASSEDHLSPEVLITKERTDESWIPCTQSCGCGASASVMDDG